MPDKQYYDLHVKGLGYLGRIFEGKSNAGDRFIACDIWALCGWTGDPQQRRFDVTVSGKSAQELIRQCQPAIDAGRKVQIGFCLSDVWPCSFTHKKGKSEGKTGLCLKSRLLAVYWIRIDGELTYTAPPKVVDEDVDDTSPDDATDNTEDFWP